MDTYFAHQFKSGQHYTLPGTCSIEGNLPPNVTLTTKHDLYFDGNAGEGCIIFAGGKVTLNSTGPHVKIRAAAINGGFVGVGAELIATTGDIQLEKVGSGSRLEAKGTISFEKTGTNCTCEAEKIMFDEVGEHAKLIAVNIAGEKVGSNSHLTSRRPEGPSATQPHAHSEELGVRVGTLGSAIIINAQGDVGFESSDRYLHVNADGVVRFSRLGDHGKLLAQRIEAENCTVGDHASLTTTAGDMDLEKGILGLGAKLDSAGQIRFQHAGNGCIAKAALAIVGHAVGLQSKLGAPQVDCKNCGSGTWVYNTEHPYGVMYKSGLVNGEPPQQASAALSLPSPSVTGVNLLTEKASPQTSVEVETNIGLGILDTKMGIYSIPEITLERYGFSLLPKLEELGAKILLPSENNPDFFGVECHSNEIAQRVRTAITDFIDTHRGRVNS